MPCSAPAEAKVGWPDALVEMAHRSLDAAPVTNGGSGSASTGSSTLLTPIPAH